MKQLNQREFRHISARVDGLKTELKAAQLELQDQPNKLDLQRNVVRLRKERMDICEAERSFYHQRAKCDYLKKSDKCTKFFHSMVRRNAKRNFIVTCKKEDGSLTNSQEEVASEFVGFYHRLLGTDFTCEPIDPITFGEGAATLFGPS